MLTPQQITEITSYCKAMGVRYYDVQLELVDHIADIVEQLRQQKPTLNFEDALQLASLKFAPGEFAEITKNKERQLLVRFKRLWLKEFLSYFTLPKVLLTLCLMVLVVFIIHNNIIRHASTAGFYLTLVIGVFYALYLKKGGILINIKGIGYRYENDITTLPLLVHKILLKRNETMFWVLIICTFISLFIKETLVPSGIIKETLFMQFQLYPIPLFVIFCLAWRKVYLEQNILMRKQYALAFEN